MKTISITCIIALVMVSGCSPGSESGLTRAEMEKYEAWVAETEQRQAETGDFDTNVSAAEAELEKLASEFLAYEAEINALLQNKSNMTDGAFDTQLAELQARRSELVARKETLEAARLAPESSIRPTDADIPNGTPFMQAAASLSNDHLALALMTATVTDGPVKRLIDADLDLRAEIANTISSQRTASTDAFRADALNALQQLERGVDDNQALMEILKRP